MVEDLVPYYSGHLEALLTGYRVHDHIAVYADKVLGVENAVFILEGRQSVSRPVLIRLS